MNKMVHMTELCCNGSEAGNKSSSTSADNQNRDTDTSQQDESSSIFSIFDIFGFGKKPLVAHPATYNMVPTMPQCHCARIKLKPVTVTTPPSNKGESQSVVKRVKVEKCARFNYWWLKCCQSAMLRKPGVYWNLVEYLDEKVTIDGVKMTVADIVLGQKTTTAIMLDIRRTYPSLRFYTRYGRIMLRRILLAYAFFDPEVGYVQGLNFIVANLLWHSTEEQAFWSFLSMMYMYDCRCMFLQGLPGVFKRCDIIEKCMQDHVPKLTEHLRNVGVHIPMIASDWLMTLCANSIPIKPLARLWDSFFAEGWIVIFRFVLCRLKQFEPYLLTINDVADIMKVIKYGHAQKAESWNFIELIPGFGQTLENKGVKLVEDAYYSNCENLTNDPNKNSNDKDWMDIVMASMKFDVSVELIDKLELQSNEDVYYECANSHKLFPNEEIDCKSEGLVSRSSSDNEENSMMLYRDAQPSEDNSPLPPYIANDKSAYETLRAHNLDDIAEKLQSLAETIRKQLADIGIANPYMLHLKALRDE